MEADDAGFCHHFKDGPILNNCQHPTPPPHDTGRNIAPKNKLKISPLLSRHNLKDISPITEERQLGYLNGLFNTLWTGDADLRLCIITVEEG